MTRYIFLLAFLLTLFYQVKSQNILSAERMDMILEAAPNDNSLSSNDTTFATNTHVVSKLIIVLQDTVHLSKIHVKLGTTNNNYNLLNKYFSFDVNGTLADGTSYQRLGNVVYLTLGTYTGLQNAFAEVKLEDTYARFTEPETLSGN
jgi:hypothetical protein